MKQTVRIERLVVGPLSTNCYLLIDPDSHEAIVVDPGDDAEYIIEKIDAFHARPTLILATHGHFDHIMGARAVQLA
ncbi:MBL fold metallo-hydrolase, partial [Candidatus Gottesmanbacteria bacterium]|nr:MBL fold metallo-hydrolase [Candidatus Gottesmanbacteria bacterium]